jgi:hypothetical protein
MSTITDVTKSFIADWEGRFHDVKTSYFDSFTETGRGWHNSLEPLLQGDIGTNIKELFNTPGQVQKHFGEFQASLGEYLADSADIIIESAAAEVGTLTGQLGASLAVGKFISDQLKESKQVTSGLEYKRGEWVVIKCGYRHQTKEKIRGEEWASVQMFNTSFDAKDEFLQPNYVIAFFLQVELNGRLSCFSFETLKTGSFDESIVEKMPETIKKSLDLNKAYSEARELYILQSANIDPKRDWKFNIGAEVKCEGYIYNIVDRMNDGRLLLEDKDHNRKKANPADVTPYRDNYSAMMDDKQRFRSSGDFVWCNISGETTLAVISYFLQDDAVVFECSTGREHILKQRYITTVDSKHYALFSNIPSFSKFRKYAVESDSFLERFTVPSEYEYICKGIFDDVTIKPPNAQPMFGENVIDTKTGKPTAGIVIKSDRLHEVEALNEGVETDKMSDVRTATLSSTWTAGLILIGVVGFFIVSNGLE